MKTTVLSWLMAGVLAASLAPSEGARAEGPGGNALLDGKTVGVLPVLAPGLARDATFQGVALMTTGTVKHTGYSPRALARVSAESGFGFAGASTDNDIALMRVGSLVGGLALELNDAASFAESVGLLGQAREQLAPLSPDVLAAYDRFLAAAKDKRIDAAALASLFSAAEAGIARGPARAHGYLCAGLWFGLAMVGASTEGSSPDFAVMAYPLAVMFDEDTEFEGSDRKLARSLREVAGLLTAPRLDGPKFMGALKAVYAVEADTGGSTK